MIRKTPQHRSQQTGAPASCVATGDPHYSRTNEAKALEQPNSVGKPQTCSSNGMNHLNYRTGMNTQQMPYPGSSLIVVYAVVRSSG